DGLPMLHVEHPNLSGPSRLLKAVVDRLSAFTLLVLLMPVLAGIAFAVRLTSPGPVLFRQVRVGKDGREFVMYKFRTMYADAAAPTCLSKRRSNSACVMSKTGRSRSTWSSCCVPSRPCTALPEPTDAPRRRRRVRPLAGRTHR